MSPREKIFGENVRKGRTVRLQPGGMKKSFLKRDCKDKRPDAR